MARPFSICVYCGSRSGADPALAAAAAVLGRAVAEAGARLVYGGGRAGLMGIVADAAMAAGGPVLGVIPEHMAAREWAHEGLDALIRVEDMHVRKSVMLSNADAVIALPGGLGTLEELFEALTWSSLGLHRKPVAILDVNGYWRPLRALIDHAAAAGFVDQSKAAALLRLDDPAAAPAALIAAAG